jgi:signal transduction histidine kinase
MNHQLILLMFWLSFSVLGQKPYPDPQKNYSKASLEQFLQYYQSKKDTTGLAFTHLTYAKNQERWNNAQESPVKNYRKSIEFFEVLKDSINYHEANGSLGIYFMGRPFFNKYSREYLSQSCDFFRRKKLPRSEVGHLINLANGYIYEDNFKVAQKLLERCEKLNTYVKDSLYAGRIAASYADLYCRKKDMKMAYIYAEKSLKIAKSLKVNWLEAVSYFYLSVCNKMFQKNKEATENLMQSLKITENDFIQLPLRKEVYRNLGYLYEENGDYKQANHYMQMALHSSESNYMSSIELDVRLVREYKLIEEQNTQLAKVALEKKLTDAALTTLQSRQKLYILSILLAIFFIGILAYTYISRQRFNRLEADKVKKNIQIETLRALINGQEIERLRVSQELHDGLGTLLSRIKFQTENNSTSKEQIAEMIDDACAEVRIISSNLQPNALAKFGLIRSIDDLVLKQKSTVPNIIFQHFGREFDITPENSLMIFRIIQELLTNALKHAEATEILIQIVYHEKSTMTITVEDDGIGFDDSNVQPENNGWNNIRSRVNYLQGIINFHSDPSSGTSVTISIPFV